MPSERSRLSTPSAWLSAAPRRSGARFVIASYTQHSHTITSASVHQRARASEVREGGRDRTDRDRASPCSCLSKRRWTSHRSYPPDQRSRERPGCRPAAAKACPARAAARRPCAARSRARSSRRRRAAAAPSPPRRPRSRARRSTRAWRAPPSRGPSGSTAACASRARAPARSAVGIEHAVRRAVQADRAAGGRLDRVLRAGDVRAHLPRRQAQQVAMAVAVQADLVARRRRSRRASAGLRRTCSPTRKKVARTPAAARISSTAGVPCAWGPSSKVSAYPRPLAVAHPRSRAGAHSAGQ